MSGGPGAYLEPEAAAAQIASWKRGDYDSDDIEGDVLGDAAMPPAHRKPKKEASPAPGKEAGTDIKLLENGTPSAAVAEVDVGAAEGAPGAVVKASLSDVKPMNDVKQLEGKQKEEVVEAGLDVGDESVGGGGEKEAVMATAAIEGGADGDGEEEEDMIDVDDDGADPNDAEARVQRQMEQARRHQEERKLARLDEDGGGVHAGCGDNTGRQRQQEREDRGENNRDRSGTQDGYEDGQQHWMGETDGQPHCPGGEREGGVVGGRGRKNSFEDNTPNPPGASSSDGEEAEVDWDDSADEDMDAAQREAMEQAKIGMARAAARDLRESRATRFVCVQKGARVVKMGGG